MESLKVFEELKTGGEWLGSARRWMQSNIRRGDTLAWSSDELVSIPFCKLEEFARHVAIAAVTEERRKKAAELIIEDCDEFKIIGYRFRHSEQENWNYGTTPQNLWECQALIKANYRKIVAWAKWNVMDDPLQVLPTIVSDEPDSLRRMPLSVFKGWKK